MQHAAVATTLRDARLVWRAVDTGQLNLQVMIIIVVAAMAAVVVVVVVVVAGSVTHHHITASTSQRFVLSFTLPSNDPTFAAVEHVAADNAFHSSPSCPSEQSGWKAHRP